MKRYWIIGMDLPGFAAHAHVFVVALFLAVGWGSPRDGRCAETAKGEIILGADAVLRPPFPKGYKMVEQYAWDVLADGRLVEQKDGAPPATGRSVRRYVLELNTTVAGTFEKRPGFGASIYAGRPKDLPRVSGQVPVKLRVGLIAVTAEPGQLAKWGQAFSQVLPPDSTESSGVLDADVRFDAARKVYVSAKIPTEKSDRPFMIIGRARDRVVFVTTCYESGPEPAQYPPNTDTYFQDEKAAWQEAMKDAETFWALIEGLAGQELQGRLAARQKISPPARVVDVVKELAPMKMFKQGSAVLSLEFQIDNAPEGADPAVAVEFEIDPPSRITGVRRSYLEGGKASTTFVFNPSTAGGQGGVIYARARYPKSLARHGDRYVASPEKKTATIRIHPICPYANSIYYADSLISDITYDMDDLKKQFAEAIDKYGAERVDASAYSSLTMFIHMSIQGTDVNKLYFTGHEVKLGHYVMTEGSQANPVTPGQLFYKALELNGGDMTKALLTCHNLLRAAARGLEDFSDQVPFAKGEMKKLTPKEREERAIELGLVANLGRTTPGQPYNAPYKEMLDKLKPLRPGDDNPGAWYHLFGTATASLGSQSNYLMSSDVNAPLNLRPLMRPAICWGEEYLISGDIYSDPNEYCIDVRGLHLGDFLRERLAADKRAELDRKQKQRVEQLKADIETGIEWRLNSLKAMVGYNRDHGQSVDRSLVGIGVRCPVTTTVTDKKNGRFFRLDQKSLSLDGNLPARFGLNPDGKYYQAIIYVPRVDLEIRCEALEDKSFSLDCLDFATKACASFENVPMAAGDTFTWTVPREDVKQEMTNQKGQAFKPTLSMLSPEEEKRVREDACRYVSERWDRAKGAPPPTDGKPPGQEVGASTRTEPPVRSETKAGEKGAGTPPTPPADSAKASGVWTLERIKQYERPADPHPAYPSRWNGGLGQIATEVGVLDVAPPGKQVFQFSWTDPPKTLTPGQKARITLEGRVQANQTRGRFLDGSIRADLDAFDVMPGLSTKSRLAFSEGQSQGIELNQSSPEGTAARFEGEVEVPDVGYAGSDRSGRMQLRVVITHRSIVAFRYVYRWVPAKAGTDAVGPEPGGTAETIENAVTISVPAEWRKMSAAEGNIAKGCAWAMQSGGRFAVELQEEVKLDAAQGFVLKQKKDVQVGGRDATYYLFSQESQGVSWKVGLIRLKDSQANGRPVAFSLMAPESAWKDLVPIFNKVLASVRFTPRLLQDAPR